MEQVSKPVLIALAAVLVFVAAHFTVLAPKSDSASAPTTATAPGQAGLENAIAKAKGAVAASKASATRHEQAAAAASGGTEAVTPSARPGTTAKAKAVAAPVKPKPPAPPLPKLGPGDRSGPILQELASGKVVVAIFYDRAGADDRAALQAVRATARHGGRVVVYAIPIGQVGDYNALTASVQVLQSPTVLVIGPDHKATTIVGYTEVQEIDQTVFDVGKFARQHPRAHH